MSDLISRDNLSKYKEKLGCNEPLFVDAYYSGWNDAIDCIIKNEPSAEPYTEEEILTMQELEQAQIQKAFELGREDAQPEIIKCEDCMHNGSFDTDCPIGWNGKEYCSFAERRTDE